MAFFQNAFVEVARGYYDPELGRFIQPDKLTVDGLNRYAYAKNNPVKFIDPSGNYTQEEYNEGIRISEEMNRAFDQMVWINLGKDENGKDIIAYQIGDGKKEIVGIIAGLHVDENEGTDLGYTALFSALRNGVDKDKTLIILPEATTAGRYKNGEANRGFGHGDGGAGSRSEETAIQNLINYMKGLGGEKVTLFSFHSYSDEAEGRTKDQHWVFSGLELTGPKAGQRFKLDDISKDLAEKYAKFLTDHGVDVNKNRIWQVGNKTTIYAGELLAWVAGENAKNQGLHISIIEMEFPDADFGSNTAILVHRAFLEDYFIRGK